MRPLSNGYYVFFVICAATLTGRAVLDSEFRNSTLLYILIRGAGRYPHWGATLFCGPRVLAGLLYMPRRILAAWRHGRRNRSLYRHADLGALLDMPLAGARDLVCGCHPGLDPGSMNTAASGFRPTAFRDSGFRRNDENGRASSIRVRDDPALTSPP